MAITYPIVLPHQGFASIRMRPRNAVAVQQSPFTFQQKVQANQGQRWEIDVSYPPLRQSGMADDVVAALTSLRGPYGTFLLGDSSRKSPRGAGAVANSSNTVGPYVYGDGQTGLTLSMYGLGANSQIFKPGDLIQLGGENLLIRSAELNNSAWEKNDVSISADTANSADGTPNTADRITPIGSDTYLDQSVSIPSDGFYTFSFWAKAVSGSVTGQLSIRSNAILTTKSFTVGTSYSRVFVSGYLAATSSHVYIGGFGPSITGAIDVWGSQLNRGYEADPYIPTVSAAVSINRRLYNIVSDAWSDGSGVVDVNIWPRLRESPLSGSTIKIRNCQGTFRLAGDFEWDVDSAKTYGVSFSAVEAI